MVAPPSWFSQMGGRGEYSKQYILAHSSNYQYIPSNRDKAIQIEYKPRINKDYLDALLSYAEPDLQKVREDFRVWSSYDEYLVLRKDSQKEAGVGFKAVKMAKRGNDVYSWRVKKRLKGLEDVPDLQFFNPKNRSKTALTSCLFITLTFRRTERVDQAWRLIGIDYNRFISALRRRYGKVHAIRCWEAQNDGYPHIHAVLYFENHEFNAFFYNGTWRIQEKRDIEPLWALGFSDIEALGSLRGGVRYVVKYLNKLNYSLSGKEVAPVDVDAEEIKGFAGLVNRASDLTMALCWATSRRAYGVSKGLLDMAWDTLDLTSYCVTQTGQVDLTGQPVFSWSLLGFWGGDLGVWCKDLDLRDYRDMKNSSTWSDTFT